GAAGDSVCGLCVVAAGVAERGAVAEAERVLAGGAGGSAGAAGVADGQAEAGAAELCWGMRAGGDRAGVGEGAEGVEPAAGDDIIHDVAERMGGGVGEIIGTVRGGDRNTGSKPEASGDGGADRIFREHAGVAHRSEGRAERGGDAEAGEGSGAGGAGT